MSCRTRTKRFPLSGADEKKPEIYSHLNWPVDMDKNTGESSEVAEGKTSRKKLLLFSPSFARSPQYTYELGGSKVSEISSSSDVKFFCCFSSLDHFDSTSRNLSS